MCILKNGKSSIRIFARALTRRECSREGGYERGRCSESPEGRAKDEKFLPT
jgi:hypothetical protein